VVTVRADEGDLPLSLAVHLTFRLGTEVDWGETIIYQDWLRARPRYPCRLGTTTDASGKSVWRYDELGCGWGARGGEGTYHAEAEGYRPVHLELSSGVTEDGCHAVTEFAEVVLEPT